MHEKIICKKFDDLSPSELYDALQLRHAVFVVEQNCRVPDLDNKDQYCHHLLIYRNQQLEGYARLLPAGINFPEMSIGRIVATARSRGTGLGKLIVNEAVRNLYRIHGKAPIRIAAQSYARAFYEKLGFSPDGDDFDYDGIDHVLMVKGVAEPAT